MKNLQEVTIVKNNLATKKYVEQGDLVWDYKDGLKRKQILEEVGLEYKQINYLAEVVAELVKLVPDATSNPVILNALAKFEKIKQIRESK